MPPVESIRVSADRTCRFRQIIGSGFRLAVELTTRCNLACAHCFVSHTAATLPFGRLDSVLAQAAQAGCRKVILTGGEPLLHPEILRIVARCRDLGMLADLNSNLILDEGQADELVSAGLREASASLYGRPETHGLLTRSQHAFERTVRGIRLMTERHVTVDVHSALWPDNLRDVDYLADLCCDLGCASLTFFSIIHKHGDATFKIDRSEAMAAIANVRSRAPIPIRAVGFAAACSPGECTMGTAVIGITADLHVKPCLLARQVPEHVVSLHQHDFLAALALVRDAVACGQWQPACTGAT